MEAEIKKRAPEKEEENAPVVESEELGEAFERGDQQCSISDEVHQSAMEARIKQNQYQEIQAWLWLLRNHAHLSGNSSVLEVDSIFAALGNQVSEEEFLEWVVAFQGYIEFGLDNQTVLCGVRLDDNGSGDCAEVVYIRLRLGHWWKLTLLKSLTLTRKSAMSVNAV